MNEETQLKMLVMVYFGTVCALLGVAFMLAANQDYQQSPQRQQRTQQKVKTVKTKHSKITITDLDGKMDVKIREK